VRGVRDPARESWCASAEDAKMGTASEVVGST